jgi:glycosyltransferase involved in cell wall biosynthesis
MMTLRCKRPGEDLNNPRFENPTIDILIPARNEEKALPHLLKEIDRSQVRTIFVVDNGSTDDTAKVALAEGAHVVPCPEPGYGNACLAGIAEIRKNPPDILVFLDGDRSDHPEHLPELVAPIQANRADMVLGSRTLGEAESGSLTVTQRFGNWLSTFLMSFFWGVRYTDLGPFRAIAWEDLERIGMQDRNYGWTIEMQIKAYLYQLRILEIPVNYRNRIGVSKISGTLSGVVKAGSKILYTIFRFRQRYGTKPFRKASS